VNAIVFDQPGNGIVGKIVEIPLHGSASPCTPQQTRRIRGTQAPSCLITSRPGQ
jgi:hypothetical protein